MTRFTPGPDTARDFRDALGQFATGVTIVTCLSEAGPLGITANSFASVSLDPPLVLWSPARASKRFSAFEAAEHYAIHIIGEDQIDVCGHFVKNGTDFDGLDWHEGAHGVPLLDGCLARFECTRHAIHDGGDHAIIVGRVTAAAIGQGNPLLFAKGAYGRFTGAG
ncbi:flavin reductase [Alphaproteobacteria bacterium GH1-50]|uniref:Flavin reductase n=1 Tax=Kangsaoukella pontilimi TaxID=2691042 RepID=A0A7C9IQX8_9RHOB|nr:flavin reductase family protein [Kangsaoukella pontilimi]MXQ06806.1 flavin reductase [Kangsaoukella pontilimi]